MAQYETFGSISNSLKEVTEAFDQLAEERAELVEMIQSKIHDIDDNVNKSELLGLLRGMDQIFHRFSAARIRIGKMAATLGQLEKGAKPGENKGQPTIVLIDDAEGNPSLRLQNVTYEWKKYSDAMDLMRGRIDGYGDGTLVKLRTTPTRMHRHRHTEREVIIILKGRMVDHVSGKEIGPHESMNFEPMQYHEPEFTEDSFALLLFTPKLQEVT